MKQDDAAPLSDRQRAVLSAIERHLKATGEVPSLSYLARRLSLDRSTVREHIEALYRKGRLRAPAPGPPLPIPPRDEPEDAPVPTAVAAAVAIPPGVTVEKVTRMGEALPSAAIVKREGRAWRMEFTRTAGQISAVDVKEQT